MEGGKKHHGPSRDVRLLRLWGCSPGPRAGQGKPERTCPSPSRSAAAPPGEPGPEQATAPGFVLPPAPPLATGAAAAPEEEHHHGKLLFRPLAKHAVAQKPAGKTPTRAFCPSATSELEPAVALKMKTRESMRSNNEGRLSLSGEAAKMKFFLTTSWCGRRKGRNASFPSRRTCEGGSENSSQVFLPYVPSRTRQPPNFPISCAMQPSPMRAPSERPTRWWEGCGRWPRAMRGTQRHHPQRRSQGRGKREGKTSPVAEIVRASWTPRNLLPDEVPLSPAGARERLSGTRARPCHARRSGGSGSLSEAVARRGVRGPRCPCQPGARRHWNGAFEHLKYIKGALPLKWETISI